ncbi:hypothetical protein FHR81_001100 [Actinoalloteichus hoggarensis]|uniref:Uncharacterized protein n=1 Tax=Actinoalloteichus hoggarensis TaxID=1470176 RepID=A0A221VZ64_9PSEU|nr:hypothetical protein AHOG_05915 [Actinoalloteichus hoggarensis]MBB5920070.1 hypothetical protein [Actinoalloteichus hoggarensis]
MRSPRASISVQALRHRSPLGTAVTPSDGDAAGPRAPTEQR